MRISMIGALVRYCHWSATGLGFQAYALGCSNCGKKSFISMISVMDFYAKSCQVRRGTDGMFSTTRIEWSSFNVLIYVPTQPQ
jgi:hypothetical protein